MSCFDSRPSDKTLFYGYLRHLNDKYCKDKSFEFICTENTVDGRLGVELESFRPFVNNGYGEFSSENCTYGNHFTYGGLMRELRQREKSGELSMRVHNLYLD